MGREGEAGEFDGDPLRRGEPGEREGVGVEVPVVSAGEVAVDRQLAGPEGALEEQVGGVEDLEAVVDVGAVAEDRLDVFLRPRLAKSIIEDAVDFLGVVELLPAEGGGAESSREAPWGGASL